MSYSIPDGLRPFVYILVGEEWPDVDVDKLRAWAAAYRQLGKDLSGVEGDIQDALAAILATSQSPAIAAVVQYLEQLIGSSSATLPLFRANLDIVADALDDIALQIEHSQLIIILMAAYLFATIIWLLALGFYTFGATGSAARALTRVYQEVAKHLLLNLRKSIVFGFFFLAGMDGFAQFIEWAKGHRHHFDYGSTLTMGGLGALGGAIGWGLGGARRLPGGRTIWASIIKEAAGEAATEWIADQIFGGNVGRDVVGGVFSGGVEGAIGHGTKHLSHRLPNANPFTNWGRLFSNVPKPPPIPLPEGAGAGSVAPPPGVGAGSGAPPVTSGFDPSSQPPSYSSSGGVSVNTSDINISLGRGPSNQAGDVHDPPRPPDSPTPAYRLDSGDAGGVARGGAPNGTRTSGDGPNAAVRSGGGSNGNPTLGVRPDGSGQGVKADGNGGFGGVFGMASDGDAPAGNGENGIGGNGVGGGNSVGGNGDGPFSVESSKEVSDGSSGGYGGDRFNHESLKAEYQELREKFDRLSGQHGDAFRSGDKVGGYISLAEMYINKYNEDSDGFFLSRAVDNMRGAITYGGQAAGIDPLLAPRIVGGSAPLGGPVLGQGVNPLNGPAVVRPETGRTADIDSTSSGSSTSVPKLSSSVPRALASSGLDSAANLGSVTNQTSAFASSSTLGSGSVSAGGAALGNGANVRAAPGSGDTVAGSGGGPISSGTQLRDQAYQSLQRDLAFLDEMVAQRTAWEYVNVLPGIENVAVEDLRSAAAALEGLREVAERYRGLVEGSTGQLGHGRVVNPQAVAGRVRGARDALKHAYDRLEDTARRGIERSRVESPEMGQSTARFDTRQRDIFTRDVKKFRGRELWEAAAWHSAARDVALGDVAPQYERSWDGVTLSPSTSVKSLDTLVEKSIITAKSKVVEPATSAVASLVGEEKPVGSAKSGLGADAIAAASSERVDVWLLMSRPLSNTPRDQWSVTSPGLYKTKPIVQGGYQFLAKASVPRDLPIDLTDARDLALAEPLLAGSGLGGAARRALVEGYELFVPPDAMHQVRVERVYKPRSGLYGSGRYSFGAYWDAKRGHPVVGKLLSDLYVPVEGSGGDLGGPISPGIRHLGVVPRPNWPVEPLLRLAATTPGMAFTDGLRGRLSMSWAQVGGKGGGGITGPVRGQVVYAAYTPGGLERQVKGASKSAVYTAGVMQPRFIAGGLPILEVDGKTLTVGDWVANDEFAGPALVGGSVETEKRSTSS